MKNSRLVKWIGIFFIVLLVNTSYISAFASPTIFYFTNVIYHLASGVVLALALFLVLRNSEDLRNGIAASAGFFAVSTLLALYLLKTGNTTDYKWVLWSHIGSAGLGVVCLIPFVSRMARQHGGGWATFKSAFQYSMILLVLFPAATAVYRRAFPEASHRIKNPLVVPTSMAEEGGGPKSPFYPSSAKTNVGGIIPSNFFMDSEACGACHKDIYEQWKSSMHHFASFNNQFYRKSIEYMQSVVGLQPSKWCAGCHDHAVFFNGRFDKPIKDQIDTPEAHAGLACTSCHSIVHVDSSMGNGGFTIEYPPLHEIATSKNKYIRAFDHFITYLNPVPHKQAFMKPFMRQDTAEYCSSCHKVHLDVPVNSYRWFRGFNDYDNWQASGFGQGARSFYYPPKKQHCGDCHMPLVKSNDPGNRGGEVHSHRFPGANMAVPTANRDHAQLGATERFLKSGFITVDIFAVSPVEDQKGQTAMIRRAGEGPQLMSSTAVGEEAEQSGNIVIREVGKIAAPIDRSGVHLKPGSEARVDVVVRTRKIGHFFPGGTLDSFDIWLELQAKDATGKIIYWSGQVSDEGKGPVEPGAHFYRSYQLDGEGNPINKRNAWQARSVLYVRAIQPGAADTVHYRVKVPKDAKGPITFATKLNYRKFSHYYTQFAYAGQPKPGQDEATLLSKSHNSLAYSFDKANIPKNVSGQIKDEIPDVPIITLAEAKTEIPLGDGESEWKPVAEKKDRERWNDWGIGLLLQGDLKAAEFAFRKVTEAEPGYADGWLNVARALIQEGETDASKPFIKKALEIDPKLGRIYYFKALIEKADGEYDAALTSLRTAEAMYPRDRVVLNQIARILFLKREYAEAIKVLDRVCLVDPEDVQMHYTAMLCHRGMGNAEKAAREESLFRRFKVEEAAQSITGKRRLVSPEDNNERQTIHDHESVSLTAPKAPAPSKQVRVKKEGRAETAAGGSE
ncbi:MAG: tetratricopeptide repeat protein [Bryobacterales bacterium]|nr:tetratricopeptide repeat protein [Bryobacterales bacterium]